MYAIDDRFFTETQDIAEYLEYEFLVEQADDFTVEAYECDLEIIGFLNGKIIAERVFDEDRFSEEMNDDQEKISKILDANIDFEKINSLLPKLWYPSDRKVIFTKAELIAEIIDYQ
jgi:uncharacterized protein YozE (UPF0346 family)